jgi:hypothetical protein
VTTWASAVAAQVQGALLDNHQGIYNTAIKPNAFSNSLFEVQIIGAQIKKSWRLACTCQYCCGGAGAQKTTSETDTFTAFGNTFA